MLSVLPALLEPTYLILLFRHENEFTHEPPDPGRSGDSVGLTASVAH